MQGCFMVSISPVTSSMIRFTRPLTRKLRPQNFTIS